METCAWCERPIRSEDAPSRRPTTVDIVNFGGRAVSSAGNLSYHIEGHGCYRAAKQHEQAAMAARREAANAA